MLLLIKEAIGTKPIIVYLPFLGWTVLVSLSETEDIYSSDKDDREIGAYQGSPMEDIGRQMAKLTKLWSKLERVKISTQ